MKKSRKLLSHRKNNMTIDKMIELFKNEDGTDVIFNNVDMATTDDYQRYYSDCPVLHGLLMLHYLDPNGQVFDNIQTGNGIIGLDFDAKKIAKATIQQIKRLIYCGIAYTPEEGFSIDARFLN